MSKATIQSNQIKEIRNQLVRNINTKSANDLGDKLTRTQDFWSNNNWNSPAV